MKKIHTLLLLISTVFVSAFGASTSYTIDVDGVEREYTTVTPDNKVGSYKSVIVFLHGLGGKITDCDEIMCYTETAQEIADFTGSIVLLPQALNEQNPEIVLMSELLAVNSSENLPDIPSISVWNAGASIKLSEITKTMKPNEIAMIPILFPGIFAAQKVVLNERVDDVAFINKMIDHKKASGDILANINVYVVGISMGGSMAYRYAYSENSQATAIAVISGFVGAEVNANKPLGIPACIFHSTDDEVVLFNGGVFNKPIPEIVSGISSKSDCWAIPPTILDIPNIAADGITVTKATFPCESALHFYTLTGAGHIDFMRSDYVTGPNDIDYLVEIWDFFNGGITGIENNRTDNSIAFFSPNPAKENISFAVSGNYELKDVTGKTILKGNAAAGETISTGNIPAGLYIVTLKSGEGNFVDKLIIR